VIAGPVLRALPNHPSDLVFLDPPYDQEREYAVALDVLGASPPSLVIAQHSRYQALAEGYGALRRRREVRQGDNVLSFYEGKDLTNPAFRV
jgi:16S rRNA G966 N2-methylase RsmD